MTFMSFVDNNIGTSKPL